MVDKIKVKQTVKRPILNLFKFRDFLLKTREIIIEIPMPKMMVAKKCWKVSYSKPAELRNKVPRPLIAKPVAVSNWKVITKFSL